jgi:RimJ/RimL family protein N-acetyltransferase
MLETPRLILRPWRDADVEAWVAMSADPRVMEFTPSTLDRKQAQTMAAGLRARLERDGYGWWALEVKGGAAFAGAILLQEIPFEEHFTPAMEVGWWLAYDQWGHGYATEGARAALGFAFGELHRSEVVAMTTPANVRSQRVMQRLGMTRDPIDDFDHPLIDPGHPLCAHVLYRIKRPVDGYLPDVRAYAKANQPATSAMPPSGVIAPSARIPLNAKA